MDKKTQQAHDDVRTVQRLQKILDLSVSVMMQEYRNNGPHGWDFIVKLRDKTYYIGLGQHLGMRLQTPLLSMTFDEIREQYFSDILHPTENELVMFKIMHGFDWILKEDGTSNLEETFKQLEELYPHGN